MNPLACSTVAVRPEAARYCSISPWAPSASSRPGAARHTEMVAGALAAGSLRPDVRGEDLFALMNGGAWVCANVSAAQAERLVAFTMAGFAP
ncbi:hypothetical protein GCM10009609_47940 [Pseudonocardia aurantiaca]|uniref:Transcriptional regulator SbtR-like C-terminal domain-containing protein n=1 Tax=Pseudonocardia aurantiaca TaxID=75290 RepID=A0ABW4FWU7_9PSEU